MDTITHDSVLAMWVKASEMVSEPSLLVMPSADPEMVSVAMFKPTDERPVDRSLMESVDVIRSTIAAPALWAALAAPGYVKPFADKDRLPEHGDLEERYRSGDLEVKEVVITMVATLTEGEPITIQTFVQPHLTADGPPSTAAPDGLMAYALKMGLLYANLPTE
jgi:hypothetical protein